KTAMQWGPAGTERGSGIARPCFGGEPSRTWRFPVAASAAAPAPSAKATAAMPMASSTRDRLRSGSSTASAPARARADASLVGLGRRPNAASRRCSSSSDIIHLVAPAKFLERAGKSGVHGADGDVEQLRDRRRCVAEPVSEHDHDTALQRELRDRVEQISVTRGDVVPLESRQLGLAGDQAALGPEEVETTVDHDPMQPWAKRPPL